MCDLLHIKTDRSAMIGDDQSGLSISGKPIYHFVVTSIFNGSLGLHGPNHDEAEADCILTRLGQLDQIFKHAIKAIGMSASTVDLFSLQSQPITIVSSNDDKKAEEKKE
ncbi:Alcohol dehydrogenase 1 [Carex littledalei]|uniref:Alcohol dehydrogenase 1 n=1 Tax=Carex littledalei TaxID=544730 RepID=A0A833QUB5_9POAL|nr:Alcohol dehydrogenase 1 [Carex littledalei]